MSVRQWVNLFCIVAENYAAEEENYPEGDSEWS